MANGTMILSAKIIFGVPHGEVLGAHIVGSEAVEMIGELRLAITL